MAKVERFEDLDVWQEARELCKRIHSLTCQPAFKADYALCNQINRAAGSIMDNIAEGFGRESRKEFVNFLSISMGSAREVCSQLYRATDKWHINATQFQDAYDHTERICKMITKLRQHLKRTISDSKNAPRTT